MGLLRSALASDENADAFDHLRWRARSFGQKDIGRGAAIKTGDRARHQQGRQRRVELFRPTDQFVAIHLRHMKIGEKQVERSRYGLLDNLERVVRGEGRDDTVAARFQQEGADREYLFVVVYAKDRLLRPQSSLASAGGPP